MAGKLKEERDWQAQCEQALPSPAVSMSEGVLFCMTKMYGTVVEITTVRRDLCRIISDRLGMH